MRYAHIFEQHRSVSALASLAACFIWIEPNGPELTHGVVGDLVARYIPVSNHTVIGIVERNEVGALDRTA